MKSVLLLLCEGTVAEVALCLLAELTGAENAARIRHLMGFSAVQEDTGGD